MKEVNVIVKFDEEKLIALKRYMGKKDLEPEAELADSLMRLYEKHVPAPVREYIEDSESAAAFAKPKRPYRTARSKSQSEVLVEQEDGNVSDVATA